jgi:hypothetical protein
MHVGMYYDVYKRTNTNEKGKKSTQQKDHTPAVNYFENNIINIKIPVIVKHRQTKVVANIEQNIYEFVVQMSKEA